MRSTLALALVLGSAPGFACSARTAGPAQDPMQCPAEQCGPRPGMPNRPCSDGVTMAGPSGRCLPTTDECTWEIVVCPEDDAPAPVAGNCHPTGCSGAVCAEEDLVTTCEFRPEYACYRDAECARQPDGACGWSPSAELDACLADPPPA